MSRAPGGLGGYGYRLTNPTPRSPLGVPRGGQMAPVGSRYTDMAGALRALFSLVLANSKDVSTGTYHDADGNLAHDMSLSMDGSRLCTVTYYGVASGPSRRPLQGRAFHLHWIKEPLVKGGPSHGEDNEPSEWVCKTALTETSLRGLFNRGPHMSPECRLWCVDGPMAAMISNWETTPPRQPKKLGTILSIGPLGEPSGSSTPAVKRQLDFSPPEPKRGRILDTIDLEDSEPEVMVTEDVALEVSRVVDCMLATVEAYPIER